MITPIYQDTFRGFGSTAICEINNTQYPDDKIILYIEYAWNNYINYFDPKSASVDCLISFPQETSVRKIFFINPDICHKLCHKYHQPYHFNYGGIIVHIEESDHHKTILYDTDFKNFFEIEHLRLDHHVHNAFVIDSYRISIIKKPVCNIIKTVDLIEGHTDEIETSYEIIGVYNNKLVGGIHTTQRYFLLDEYLNKLSDIELPSNWIDFTVSNDGIVFKDEYRKIIDIISPGKSFDRSKDIVSYDEEQQVMGDYLFCSNYYLDSDKSKTDVKIYKIF